MGNAPQIIVPPPASSQGAKGQTMFLDCLATGTPIPHIYWYYVGRVWSQHVKHSITNDSIYSIYDNGTLVIRNLGEKNTGFYECGASNVMGTATRKCKVYIPSKLCRSVKSFSRLLLHETVLKLLGFLDS